MTTKGRVSAAEREKMISEAAYFRALDRGFEGGDPVSDWLNAERAIDAQFKVAPHDKKLAELYEQLAEANEKVRELTEEFKSEARDGWAEEVERIERLRDGFSEKLEEIREHTGEAKKRAKRQADTLWRDLNEGLTRIGGHPD